MILDAIRKQLAVDQAPLCRCAFDRRTLMDKAAIKEFVVDVIRRVEGHNDFEMPPRRWVVERTFGWMTRWRRLVRHYENRIDVSTAMNNAVMIPRHGGVPWRGIFH